MGIRVTVEYHIVDELPHGQAAAIAQGAGEVHVYWSRQHPLDRIAADMSQLWQELVLDAYVIHERPPLIAV